MHPGIIAVALGGLIFAADAKKRGGQKAEKPDADEIAEIRDRLQKAESALAEAEANKIDAGRLSTLEADRDELKKELAGLRAGKDARDKEPPAPKPEDKPEDEPEDEPEGKPENEPNE